MPPPYDIEHIRRVKEQYEARLLKLANVVGLGIGLKETDGQLTDQLAVIINVAAKKPVADLLPEDIVPPELDGVPTDVQEIGQFSAL